MRLKIDLNLQNWIQNVLKEGDTLVVTKIDRYV